MPNYAAKKSKSLKRIDLQSTKSVYTPVHYTSVDLSVYDKNDLNRIKRKSCEIVFVAFENADETEMTYIKEDAVVTPSIYPATETKLSFIKLSAVGNSRLLRVAIVVKL